MDRSVIVHENFLRRVAAGDLPPGAAPKGPLTAELALSIYRSACLSRALDREARVMQAAGKGFYTIGSSGHEGMAAVAAALRVTDMAFLHYRDAAFQIQRATQLPEAFPPGRMMRDMLLSFACSAEDPISGGRHKVLGSRDLFIPPQTSTIASHLPKAVGAAWSIGAAKRHRPEHAILPDDGLIFCSFGDASVNHSTAQGAFNTAAWTAFQALPMPLLFCCEDNGIGISTRTPKGWIAANFARRPGIEYFACDGLDLFDTFEASKAAADYVRSRRKPAFLHISTLRLYGHAGADMPTTYLPKAEVEAEEANEPLLHSLRLLVESGAATAAELLDIYNSTSAQVTAMAQEVISRPRLSTAAGVMASLIPPPRRCRPGKPPEDATAGSDATAVEEPQILSRQIGRAIADLMAEYGETVLMGEDIGRKGGVYGVTQKLQSRFGPDRVIDTLLDEQSILGLAIGMAQNGFVPMPEIQFLAYLHNAEDQIRGEAATLPFFSMGQFTNPMVLRIAGLGYQKGFGGHFHNDNSFAVLRDIPGVILAVPSDGADAVRMLRECHRLAREEQRVVVFLEPIALYPMRDLHAPKDGGWLRPYPAAGERIALGEIGQAGAGRDLAIVTFGNGRYLSEQARPALEALGIGLRIIDLRWISPLPEAALIRAVQDCDHVLVVDETRRSGGLAEALMALLAEAGMSRIARLTAEDSFIPTGPAYAVTMPSRETIIAAARQLLGR